MLSQKSISDFGVFEVQSARSPHLYEVTIDENGKWQCNCEYKKEFKYKTDCRHIKDIKLDILRRRLDYLEGRTIKESKAFFDCFEMVMARYEWASEKCKNPNEYNDLFNLFLTQCYNYGQAIADDVYEIVEGKFQGDPKILGVVIGSASRKKLVKSIGRVKSSRPITHGRKIDIWVLTEKGKKLFPYED